MRNDEHSELFNGLLANSNSICMPMGNSFHLCSLAIEALTFNLDYDLCTTGCLVRTVWVFVLPFTHDMLLLLCSSPASYSGIEQNDERCVNCHPFAVLMVFGCFHTEPGLVQL